MSDQPVTLAVLKTALAQCHREIMLPDMNRVVEDLFERRIKPRLDQIDRQFDVIIHKLDKMLESASTSSSTRSDDHH